MKFNVDVFLIAEFDMYVYIFLSKLLFLFRILYLKLLLNQLHVCTKYMQPTKNTFISIFLGHLIGFSSKCVPIVKPMTKSVLIPLPYDYEGLGNS